jgi:two-component system response regulator DctR
MGVYLLDDDPGIRTSTVWAFQSAGLELRAFGSPEQLLNDISHHDPSCLILDLQLEGMSGLECLRDERFKEKANMPVIVVTGTADVEDAVQSMKLGVVDFFEKPVDIHALIDSARRALKADADRLAHDQERLKILGARNRLSDRERQIVALICEGYSSKQIAAKLEISVNTVANHRACLRRKTHASNTAEMIRIAILANAA